MGQRTVLVTAHIGRENALRSARFVAERLTAAGIAVRTLAGEFASPGAHEVPASHDAARGAELVIVLGGDGSLLRAAEFSRPAAVPLIGVNLGHVGFLAEAEPDGLADLVERVVARDYAVEERMTIDVTEVDPDQRHLGRPGKLGGPQQAAVAAQHDDELGTLGGLVAGRNLLRARRDELARERADGDPRGGEPAGHEPGTAHRVLPPGVRRHQHGPLSH